MTGPQPPRPPPLFGLTVRFGDKWNPPTADYACRCGWTSAAAGAEAVQRFAATASETHQPRCQISQQERKET